MHNADWTVWTSSENDHNRSLYLHFCSE